MSKNSDPRKLKSAKKPKIIDRPYNHYNLYFILEHELLLQSKGVITDFLKDAVAESSGRFIRHAKSDEYRDLYLPPMPPRFQAVILPSDWFVHGKKDKTKRAQRKTHGSTSFTELAKTIASNWKQVDNNVAEYVKKVASKIMERCGELKLKAREGAVPEVCPVLSTNHITSDPVLSEKKEYLRWPVHMEVDVADSEIISMWTNAHID